MSSLRKLIDRLYDDIESKGIYGIATTIRASLRYVRRKARSRLIAARGTNVYNKDWDVLILLDCARVDMMQEVCDEYPFLKKIDSHRTTGTNSARWMNSTFTSEYKDKMANSVYITGNMASEENLSNDQFHHLEEVWRDGYDEEFAFMPAREITDRAIYYGRKSNYDRMIVHYMQPHLPFILFSKEDNESIQIEDTQCGGMTVGGLYKEENWTRQQLWDSHIENLQYVLNYINILLSNLDADKVVISADHGQAFGENGVWGHPPAQPIDAIQFVPWCITSSSDSGKYKPDYSPSDSIIDEKVTVDEKLKALGYQ